MNNGNKSIDNTDAHVAKLSRKRFKFIANTKKWVKSNQKFH